MGKQWLALLFWAPRLLQKVTAAIKLKDSSCRKSYDKPRQCMTKQRYHFADKGQYSQSCGFSNSHVLECEIKWALGSITMNKASRDDKNSS